MILGKEFVALPPDFRNSIQEEMDIVKRQEAITLLRACLPLSSRLAAQGIRIELTDADCAALAGFNQVAFDDWLDDPDIHRQAGLGRADINALSFAAAQSLTDELVRQHKSGEKLDG